MRRFNSKGEFNVPYGNYKSFNPNIKKEHIEKLKKKTDIFCDTYKNVMINNDDKNTFIYVDPPYTREFKEYSHENVFGKNQQIELFDTIWNTRLISRIDTINRLNTL